VWPRSEDKEIEIKVYILLWLVFVFAIRTWITTDKIQRASECVSRMKEVRKGTEGGEKAEKFLL
jgi:hypothetical protein